MDPVVHITFRDIPSTPALEERIREGLMRLQRHHHAITACRVVVSAPHRHQHKGRTYHVSIDLSLPGRDVLVNREHNTDQAHEDAYVAIRDAFLAADRQLQEHADRTQPRVKSQ